MDKELELSEKEVLEQLIDECDKVFSTGYYDMC